MRNGVRERKRNEKDRNACCTCRCDGGESGLLDDVLQDAGRAAVFAGRVREARRRWIRDDQGGAVTGTPQAVTGTPLPEDLSNELKKLKRRTSPQKMKDLILRLCKEHPMSRDDLIFYLKRGRTTIDNYLSLMIGKELDYLYPMMVHHPRQAYVALGKGDVEA